MYVFLVLDFLLYGEMRLEAMGSVANGHNGWSLLLFGGVEQYSGLSGDDMDIEVEECLVYGNPASEYNTSAESLCQAYIDNKD